MKFFASAPDDKYTKLKFLLLCNYGKIKIHWWIYWICYIIRPFWEMKYPSLRVRSIWVYVTPHHAPNVFDMADKQSRAFTFLKTVEWAPTLNCHCKYWFFVWTFDIQVTCTCTYPYSIWANKTDYNTMLDKNNEIIPQLMKIKTQQKKQSRLW